VSNRNLSQKRSDMARTVLPTNNTSLTLPRKRSPDGATTDCSHRHLIAFIDPKGWKAELAWLAEL